MPQALATRSTSGIAEMCVRIGALAISVGTDRPSLLPSLLDRLPTGWEAASALQLARVYVLWAEKAPFRLQIDGGVAVEKADLAEVLDAFAADVERIGNGDGRR